MHSILLIPTKFEALFIGNSCKGISPENIYLSGISKKASKTLLDIINDKQISNVLLAGFAGSLNEKIKTGSTFYINKVSNINESINLPVSQKIYPCSSIITVKKPIFTEKRKIELSKHADLVDMESFTVAKICVENNIKLSIIRSVSDQCEANIATYFKECHLENLPEKLLLAGNNMKEAVCNYFATTTRV